MSKKWACRTYYNPNPFISFSWHDTIMTIPVPPFVVPTKAFHLNFSVAQGLWIGSFLSNGRGKKVVGDDLLFMGRTSDAGLVVPHISFPPTWMNLMTTLFGSSMILFGTSSVTLACKNAIWGNEDCDLALTPFGPVPLSLNLACHDPYSLPTDIVIVWGSVYAGMSTGDLLAALIDFAINLATELGMKYMAAPLAKKAGAGLKKAGGKIGALFKKAGSKGVSKVGKKAARKGIFGGIKTSFAKLSGSQATDAMKSYTKKAATSRGMYDTLKELCYSTGKNLDADLTDLIKQGTPGVFSKEFLSQMQNINSSKYDDYTKKMLSSSAKSLDSAENAGAKKIQNEFNEQFIDSIDYDLFDNEIVKYSSIMTDSIAADSVMRTTLWTAMKEMSDAAEKAASTELARAIGYVALKKSISKILYKNIIKNGGLIRIDTTILGYEIDYTSNPTRQFADKWYANQEFFGEELWTASDLGLTEIDDSEYWGDAYVESDGTDGDDYWYVGMENESTSAASAESGESGESGESDDEDEDDYWYGTDDNADAAE